MQVLIKGMQPLAKKKDKNYDGVLSRAFKPTSQAADKFTSPCWVEIQENKMGLFRNNCRRAPLRFQGHDFCCFLSVLTAKTYWLGFPEYWKQMLPPLPWCRGGLLDHLLSSAYACAFYCCQREPRGLAVMGLPSLWQTGLWASHLLLSKLH